MKKLAIALLIVAGISLSYARGPMGGGQGGPPPIPDDEQIEKMVESMSEQLQLTDAQATKVLALYSAHFEEMKENMQSGSRPDRETMEKHRSDFEASIKAILTEEQAELFEKSQNSNAPRGGRQQRN